MQTTWKPNENALHEILNLFEITASPQCTNELHSKVFQQTQEWLKNDEFSCYLAYILVLAPNVIESIKQTAGFTLRGNIRNNYMSLNAGVQEYVKNIIFQYLFVCESNILQECCSSILSTIAMSEQLNGWGTRISTIILQLSKPNEINKVSLIGCLTLLHKILQDCGVYANWSDQDVTNLLLPLSRLTECKDDKIKLELCYSFSKLLESGIGMNSPNDFIVKFMLSSSNDTNDNISTIACEYWLEVVGQETKETQGGGVLLRYVPYLVRILLNKMVYGELAIMAAQVENDSHIPDRDEDLRPYFKTDSKSHNNNNNDDDDDDGNSYIDDENEVEDWNLRKAAASTLDNLAVFAPEQVLQHIFPLFQERLTHNDWLVREAAILALGAIANGCYSIITPVLPQFVPYLIETTRHEKNLLRQISCWTLSRYSTWIQNEEKYFSVTLVALLERLVDKNKKVQESACSCVATFQEAAGAKMIPFISIVLQQLIQALNTYQRKNMVYIYDTIACLAEAVQSEINKPEYVNILMPPLLQRWDNTSDTDDRLLPLLECLAAIAPALGSGFIVYSEPVYNRCMLLIENYFLKKQHETEVDEQFAICALELLGALVEGLQSNVERLINGNTMIKMIIMAANDDNSEIRQASIALLGDLTKASYGSVRIYVKDIIELLIPKISNIEDEKVCNNAMWTLGEISIKVGEPMMQFIHTILDQINNQQVISIDENHPNYYEYVNLTWNYVILISRLCNICPQFMASEQVVPKYAPIWIKTIPFLKSYMDQLITYKSLHTIVQTRVACIYPYFNDYINVVLLFLSQQQNQQIQGDRVIIVNMFIQQIKDIQHNVGSDLWNQLVGNLNVTARQNIGFIIGNNS